MCHHIDAGDELELSDHEDEREAVSRDALEAELDRERFVALGLITQALEAGRVGRNRTARVNYRARFSTE